MRTGFILQLALLLLLLATTSEGFFFEYPKKALLEFLQSLKEKKEAKKKPVNDIRHYHLHYYPVPIQVISSGPYIKAPDKKGLDDIYSDYLQSLGWSNYKYKYTPEPKIRVTTNVHHLWNEDPYPVSWSRRISGQDDLRDMQDHDINEGVFVQVPVHQPIFENSGISKKSVTSLLAAVFGKVDRTKNSVKRSIED
ncbi:hypothetical protein KM043_008960 [Ampulex compressa]|nr:hypothetical protein KM043_008960 [Ampulex compressa]